MLASSWGFWYAQRAIVESDWSYFKSIMNDDITLEGVTLRQSVRILEKRIQPSCFVNLHKRQSIQMIDLIFRIGIHIPHKRLCC